MREDLPEDLREARRGRFAGLFGGVNTGEGGDIPRSLEAVLGPFLGHLEGLPEGCGLAADLSLREGLSNPRWVRLEGTIPRRRLAYNKTA